MFTLALYVAVIAWTIFMVWQVVRQVVNDWREHRGSRTAKNAPRSRFDTKHGHRGGRKW